MLAAAPSPVGEWESFYVIIGSSAAALTGLQFVVIALVADARRFSNDKAINAFGTPTVVHFCAALLVSAVLSAPWQSLVGPAVAMGACGVAGVAYVAMVVRRARGQTVYRPVLEDWVWHGILPLVAYAALLAGSLVLRRHPAAALFAVAGAAVLLVFVRIHNAWDSVTFIAAERAKKPED